MLFASLLSSPSFLQVFPESLEPEQVEFASLDSKVECAEASYCSLFIESLEGYFPMTRESFQRISENFRQRRSGQRPLCHRGVDLHGRGEALAVANGIVVQTSRSMRHHRFTTCHGRGVGYVAIYHPSLDMTLLYGEINVTQANSFRIGQVVMAGETLARFGTCGMLHLEALDGEADSGYKYSTWSRRGNHCGRRPSQLVDPTPFVDSLFQADAFYEQPNYTPVPIGWRPQPELVSANLDSCLAPVNDFLEDTISRENYSTHFSCQRNSYHTQRR